MTLLARGTAELVGTSMLVATVVGSGVMATRLTDDVGVQLLANSLATGAVLFALITALQPVSASFNPVVTAVDAVLGRVAWREGGAMIVAQTAGGVLGAIGANVMFDLDAVSWATTTRSDPGLWLGEVVATAGLVLVLLACVRGGRTDSVAAAVACWIVAGYWFTSSTSFANPAVTIARMFSDSFTGIDPASVPAFLLAQLVGGLIAVGLVRVLFPTTQEVAP